MYFDTHAHYDDEQFDSDRDELLATLLPAGGVSLVVNPGVDEPSSRMAVSLAEKYDYFYAAVGWHPCSALDFCDESEKLLYELAKHDKVKALIREKNAPCHREQGAFIIYGTYKYPPIL